MSEQSHLHDAAVYHDNQSRQLAAGLPDQASARFLRGILILLIGMTIATGSVATSVAIKFGQTDANRTLMVGR